MFLNLAPTKLDAYQRSLEFVSECYRYSKTLPAEERFNLIQQIRRAAISVHLNISEGSTRQSPVKRKRFYELSRGSVVEIDAALNACTALGYTTQENAEPLGAILVKTYQCLTGLIRSCSQTIQ